MGGREKIGCDKGLANGWLLIRVCIGIEPVIELLGLEFEAMNSLAH